MGIPKSVEAVAQTELYPKLVLERLWGAMSVPSNIVTCGCSLVAPPIVVEQKHFVEKRNAYPASRMKNAG
jgi:hypothetical protein